MVLLMYLACTPVVATFTVILSLDHDDDYQYNIILLYLIHDSFVFFYDLIIINKLQ